MRLLYSYSYSLSINNPKNGVVIWFRFLLKNQENSRLHRLVGVKVLHEIDT